MIQAEQHGQHKGAHRGGANCASRDQKTSDGELDRCDARRNDGRHSRAREVRYTREGQGNTRSEHLGHGSRYEQRSKDELRESSAARSSQGPGGAKHSQPLLLLPESQLHSQADVGGQNQALHEGAAMTSPRPFTFRHVTHMSQPPSSPPAHLQV